MTPLVVMGFGTLRRVCPLPTIIGVFIGVAIARPVYGVVIKELLHVEERGNGGITE